MGAPIQTLSYPSRTAACVALRAQGLTPSQIACEIGISANTVHCLLREARLRSGGMWRSASCRTERVKIPKNDLDALVPQAEKRGIAVTDLVRRLIWTIAENGLVDSVLDDADAKARF